MEQVKKIFEIAESLITLEGNEPSINDIPQRRDWAELWDQTMSKLSEAVEKRRMYENTPVLEYVLIQKGWKKDKDDPDRIVRYFGDDKLEWITTTHYLYIFRRKKTRCHPCCANIIIDRIDTLADLHDALNLCKINTEI